MKRATTIIALGGLAIALAAPPPAGAGAGVRVVKNCVKADNRPSQVVLSCGTAALYVDSIHWEAWKPHHAKGSGTLHQNVCVPSCSTGTFQDYAVKIALTRPKQTSCNGKTENVFRHVSLRFPGDRPDNHRHIDEMKLPCL